MSNVILSRQTIQVLKNFSTINGSIVIRNGNFINTQSVGQNIIAEYNCTETFPVSFAIYDLTQFLSGLALFGDNPSLEFTNEDYVVIRNQIGNRSAKYFFSDFEILESCSPSKKISFPDDSVITEFRITENDINSLHRASGVYQLSDILFTSDEDVGVTVSLVDLENETNNTYNLHLSGTCSMNKKIPMKMENIRLLSEDYDVKLTDTIITQWKHTGIDLVYYIGIEPEDN